MNSNSYIASLEEVTGFLSKLKIVLASKTCYLDILPRKKDEDPLDPCTTENTMANLNYDKEDVKAELLSLTADYYLETIKDDKYLLLPDFWVFGKKVQNKDVYIKVKIRDKVNNKVFCVSFHYARFPLKSGPYA